MTQHASLSPERWAAFSLDDRILMIANELNRARVLFGPEDRSRLRNSYERTLRLVDLTIEVEGPTNLRRELLRWRDLIAALYVSPEVDPAAHLEALRALLLLRPRAAAQIPYLLTEAR